MYVTQDAKKEILKFIEKKIETEEMWAEAFSKLITLDEPDQNGAVWDMLESIKDSIRWDELFARSPEVLDRDGRKSAEGSTKKEGRFPWRNFFALTEEDDFEFPDSNNDFSRTNPKILGSFQGT